MYPNDMMIIETKYGFELTENHTSDSHSKKILDFAGSGNQKIYLPNLGLFLQAKRDKSSSWEFFLTFSGFTFPINDLLGLKKANGLVEFLTKVKKGNKNEEILLFLKGLSRKNEFGAYVLRQGVYYDNVLKGIEHMQKQFARQNEIIDSLLQNKDEIEEQMNEMTLILYGIRNPMGKG